MNIVIMAGGGGTRLWPLSRQKFPKQFLRLDGKKTLLEMTYDRARALTDEKNIYIGTIEEYGQMIQEVLPSLPAENIFYEPQRRDNAPAFAGIAVQLVNRGHANTPTIFMWSDHVFTQEHEYIEDVKKIPALLEKNPRSIVIVGHTPTFPETGFGYIEVGEKVADFEDVYAVASFKEKPDYTTAEGYVASGKYFWNMGTISTTPAYLLEEMKKYEPELIATIQEFAANLDNKEKAKELYGQAKKISIDYALLEKTSPIFVVTGDYGWSDVGNWGAVRQVFGVDGDHVPNGHHVHVDSKNNYIYNATKKAVSLIGMEDTIVVVTDDAILVTDTTKSHRVKDVVQALEEQKKSEYL